MWNDPDKVLQYLNLGECTIMVDIGCGQGDLALEAARKLQDGGVVYGVDIKQEMIDQLKQRADAAKLYNVQTVLAEEDDEFPLPTEVADVILMANVYHEVDAASNFIGEVKRILKSGSTCLVVDWRTEPSPGGPPLEQRVDQQDVVEEFYANGFILAGTCDVGPYHYGLKFYKVTGDERRDNMADVVP
ncbi:MAG TPA: methyltransferase domain-containing protein [Symbiobacteriaceae bacterium]|nr:methyltransferase domain-containing protein [Symbiobacteriaceae bacterium]